MGVQVLVCAARSSYTGLTTPFIFPSSSSSMSSRQKHLLTNLPSLSVTRPMDTQSARWWRMEKTATAEFKDHLLHHHPHNWLQLQYLVHPPSQLKLTPQAPLKLPPP